MVGGLHCSQREEMKRDRVLDLNIVLTGQKMVISGIAESAMLHPSRRRKRV